MEHGIGYLLHLGIVRVLSVPIGVALVMTVLYFLAAPPRDLNDDEDEGGNA
jgi:hypothetical protein